MPIHRVGKEREALSTKGESYKDAVSEYMAATGYGAKTDASIEGHPTDTVYIPLAGGGLESEKWVEAKDTHLSLSNDQFLSEMKTTLAAWMKRSEAQRFEPMVFVRSLANPPRWDRTFGDKLDREAVFDWLEGGADRPIEEELDVPDSAREEILAFFSSVTIVVGSRGELLWAAEQRRKSDRSIRDIEGMSSLIRQEIARCQTPLGQPSNLVAALYDLDIPDSYVVLSVDEMPTHRYYSLLGGLVPFAVLSKGKLLTHDLDEVEAKFSDVNASFAQLWTKDEAEMIDRNALLDLLNGTLEMMLFRHGVSEDRGAYFFLAEEAIEGEARVLSGVKGDVTVASPQTVEQDSQQISSQQTGDGSLKVQDLAAEEKLNFVSHHGFYLDARHLWGDYVAQVRPKRVYTEDGCDPLPGPIQGRIDRGFRNPLFNRSATQLNRIEKILHYVLPPEGQKGGPQWAQVLQFGGLLEQGVPWSPEAPDEHQDVLSSYLSGVEEE